MIAEVPGPVIITVIYRVLWDMIGDSSLTSGGTTPLSRCLLGPTQPQKSTHVHSSSQTHRWQQRKWLGLVSHSIHRLLRTDDATRRAVCRRREALDLPRARLRRYDVGPRGMPVHVCAKRRVANVALSNKLAWISSFTMWTLHKRHAALNLRIAGALQVQRQSWWFVSAPWWIKLVE